MAFLDDLKDAARDGACFILGGYESGLGWIGDKITGGNPERAVGGARGALCEDPTPPDAPPPEYPGGQCATQYRIRFDWNECGTARSNTVGPVPGPLGGVTKTVLNPNDGSCNGETEQRRRVSVAYAGGLTANQVYTNVSGDIDITPIREDGQPDDCGNLPTPIPPYVPTPRTVPIPDPTNPTGPDIDVDVTVFAPVLVGGVVYAPVTFQGPNFDIDGRIILTPDFDIDISLGGGSSGSGGEGSPVPEEPGDIPPDDPSQPPGADGRFLLGCHVSIAFAANPKFTEIAQDGAIGSIGVPRVATFHFVANMGGTWSRIPGVELKSRRTYVPVPPGVNAVSWQINVEDGASISSVRPVYGTTAP